MSHSPDTFLGNTEKHLDSIFLIEAESGIKWSYKEVFGHGDDLVKRFPKGLLVLAAINKRLFSIAYVGALRSGRPVFVLDGETSLSNLLQIIELYRPSVVVSDVHQYLDGWNREAIFDLGFVHINPDSPDHEICKDLAALMPTSGSTGSPKAVRVSYDNVKFSTKSIGKYLEIKSTRRLITSLPLHYTYGLSLLHLSLFFGIPIVLSDRSAITREFWDEVVLHRVTDFSGVPFQYKSLARTGIDPRSLAQLVCMTQAGGVLEKSVTKKFLDISREHEIKFFTMYGQTEATPRISYVPPKLAEEKLGSAGVAIPGGRIEIDQSSNDRSYLGFVEGEIVYVGPNVSLGYATSYKDLSLGDEFKGKLRTGDIGFLDDDGFLFITGRVSRDIKVSGKRVNLDSLQNSLSPLAQDLAIIGRDDQIIIVAVSDNDKDLALNVFDRLSVHPSQVRIELMEQLPRLSSGKVDYVTLSKLFLEKND
jgi:long-chain acyl-CoA synthetase